MMEPEEEHGGDMGVPVDNNTAANNDNNNAQQRQSLLELQRGSPEDHDQLPNVEEYKAIIGHRSGGGSTSLKDKFKKVIGRKEEGRMLVPNGDNNHHARDPMERKQDPPEMIGNEYQYEEEQVEENEGLFRIDDVGEEDDQQHFETMEIEQYDARDFDISESDYEDKHDEGDPNKCFWKSCCFVVLFLLAAVLVQFFVFGTGSSPQEVGAPRDFFHFVQGDTDEYFAVRNYVVNVGTVSQEAAFDQTTTPQYLAAQWMAHGDPQGFNVPQKSDLEYTERYIMVVLFFSFGGTEWSHQYNFLSGDHICTWFQEFSLRDGSSVLYGVHRCKTGETGGLYPHSVFMPNNGLSGFIPDEVQGLERLEVFNIMFNPNIVGTIPVALASMNSLTHLALQWCNLDGTIPKWIGSMTQLEYLGLGNNLLDGTVPTEIANLQRLELLGLDDNDLFGHINTFAPLANLKSLYLENNFFNGSISDELMQGWPFLEELDLSECAFTGVLPPTMLNHNPNLQVLDLHGNEFEGPFPNSIDANSELEFLAVHRNRFDGFVPESLKNLEVVRHLDISDNLFEATLPEVMGEMTSLEYLFTGTNDFMPAEVPKFLIELTNLRELSMKQNQLEGSIPEFFLYLSNLEFLDFHGNNLSQQIPAGFGKLTSLRHLILKQNSLSGELPAEMSQMTSLQVFLMEQNKFEGNANAICNVNTFTVETFVADCGDEFIPPPVHPTGTIPTIAPTTSPNTGIIDDQPSTGGNPPPTVTNPPSPTTPIPVDGSTGSPTPQLVPTIGFHWGTHNPAHHTHLPTQDGDTPMPTTTKPHNTHPPFGFDGTFAPFDEYTAFPTGNPTPQLVPTIGFHWGTHNPAHHTGLPTRLDDDKVFTPSPTTNPPVFDDDPVPNETPATGGPPADTDGSDTGGGTGDDSRPGDFDDLSGNGGDDNGTGDFDDHGGDDARPGDDGDGDGVPDDDDPDRRRRRVSGVQHQYKFDCPCCTICCDPGDTNCNNWDWKGNLDPIWEHGYKRRRYSYDLGPVVWLP